MKAIYHVESVLYCVEYGKKNTPSWLKNKHTAIDSLEKAMELKAHYESLGHYAVVFRMREVQTMERLASTC